MLQRDMKGQQGEDCHSFYVLGTSCKHLLSEPECCVLIGTGRFRRNGVAVPSAGALRHSHDIGICSKT